MATEGIHFKSLRRFAVLAVCLIACKVSGAGFQLYTEGSAEALGQAGAISGRTNLVSLAWYNPSALAGSGQASIMAGSTFVQINTDFTSPAGNASMSDEWRTIPHFYAVLPLTDEWTTLLSVNAPYGLITEWPSDWAGAGLAIYSELRTIYITPSLAWRMTDQWSFSLGFNVVDAEAELTRTGVSLEGDDTGYGYTASAHYKPLENWALGARYQSRVDLKFAGFINGSVPASAKLELPSTWNVGLVNTSINNLSVGLDLVWTEWSTYDYLTVNGSSIPKLWDNVFSIRAGGEYALDDNWAVRAGYIWDESPIPGSTRAPELPGSDRQMLTGGVGWMGKQLGIDLAKHLPLAGGI
jgi:long-chain fatty acid transport protein